MRQWSLNKKLAATGIAMASLSLLAALALPGGLNGTRQVRFVSTLSLAEQIKSRQPLTLIDLRPAVLYEEFHLPTAINIPFEELDLEEIGDPEYLVFYSGDDLLARQLWSALPAALKARSAILYGGVHDWYDRLLYPVLPLKVAGKDSLMAEKVNELCRFYGGQPEYADSLEVIQYYFTDLSSAPWPAVKPQGKLVRKGC